MSDNVAMAAPSDAADACTHYSTSAPPEVWWEAHFHNAANQIIDFLAADGLSLEGKRVADIGCGDGIIDLGLATRARPEQLVGFDIEPTDVAELERWAREQGGIAELPDNLFFATSGERSLPAEDHSFDYVVSWSAFEHIADPVAVLREIRRVLTHHGLLFIQLWPFFDSAHGSHLVDWFPEGFAPVRYPDEEILRRVRASNAPLAPQMAEVYQTLNRITLDGLHQALTETGFQVVKVALDAESLHLPPEVRHLPLSRVAISGVRLLAIPPASDEDLPVAEEREPEPAEVASHQRDAIPPTPPPAPPPPTTTQRAVRMVRRGLAGLDGVLSRHDAPRDGS